MNAPRALALAAVAALLQACATSAPDETKYTGEIFSGGRRLPVTTVFWEDRSDRTVGRYVFVEPDGREVPGTLGPCEMRNEVVLRCEWTDTYGQGYFFARFSEDHQSFRGRWGRGDLHHTLSIDGIWHGQQR